MHEHDGILLQRWESKGDNQAFMEIVARYQAMIYNTSLRILKDHAKAEDLVQECFLKLTHTKPKATPNLGPWLHRIATNEAISQIRSDTRRTEREKKYVTDTEPQDQPVWDDINEILDEELNALPEDNRTAIIAHYLQGNTQTQVAQQLNIPRTTLNTRIQKGLDLLHQKLKSRGITLPAAALSTMMASEITNAAPATLATTMGKAVLRGTFSPAPPKTPILTKLLLTASLVTIVILSYFILNPSTLKPDTIQPTSPIPQATTIPQTMPAFAPQPTAITLATAQSPVPDETLPVAQSTPSTPVEPESEPKLIRLQCVNEAGVPIPNAQVYVHQEYEPTLANFINSDQPPIIQNDAPLTSDIDGFVEFNLLNGPETATVYRNAYAIVPDKLVGAWRENDRYGSPPAEPDSFHTITLVESRTMHGQVLIPDGYDMNSISINTVFLGVRSSKNLNGISVHSILRSGPIFPELFNIPVDSSGQFEVYDVPHNASLRMRAWGAGLGEKILTTRDVSQIELLEFNLAPHGSIEGTVTYADSGIPATNRKVITRTRNNGVSVGPHFGITNNLGKYRIEGLRDGKYEVVVGANTFPLSHVTLTKVGILVDSGYVTDSVDFQLENGIMATGTITNQDSGNPIKNVLITANSNSLSIDATFTNENGYYELRVPAGKIGLQIRAVPNGTKHPSGRDGKRSIRVAKQAKNLGPVNFKLASSEPGNQYNETGTVSGRILDQYGNPISNTLITGAYMSLLEGGMSVGFSDLRLGKTNNDGRFNIELMASVKNEVTLGGGEWSAHRTGWFTIDKNETIELGDISLIHYTRDMTIWVVDEIGTPVPGTSLKVTAENYYNPTTNLKTDSQGMLYLQNLPDTEISIVVGKYDYKEIDWKGHPGTHIEIILKRSE